MIPELFSCFHLQIVQLVFVTYHLTHTLTHITLGCFGQSGIFQNTTSTKSINPGNFQNFLKRKYYDLPVSTRCSKPLPSPFFWLRERFSCLFSFVSCRCMGIDKFAAPEGASRIVVIEMMIVVIFYCKTRLTA